MGWGTSHIKEVYFSKQTFDNIDRLDEAIEESRTAIDAAKETLCRLATMTEPQKFLNPEEYGCSDIYSTIEHLYKESIETLEAELPYLANLESLKDDWDDVHTIKDGKTVAKNPPSEINVPYMYGDYIPGDRDEEEDV